MFNKEEIKKLHVDVDRLKRDFYGRILSTGIKTELNYVIKRQNRLDRKLDMLMDYLGVEEKNEPERWYIGEKSNDE